MCKQLLLHSSMPIPDNFYLVKSWAFKVEGHDYLNRTYELFRKLKPTLRGFVETQKLWNLFKPTLFGFTLFFCPKTKIHQFRIREELLVTASFYQKGGDFKEVRRIIYRSNHNRFFTKQKEFNGPSQGTEKFNNEWSWVLLPHGSRRPHLTHFLSDKIRRAYPFLDLSTFRQNWDVSLRTICSWDFSFLTVHTFMGIVFISLL